eukprot:4557192-Alexandrium_andersonii.AAC.1
MRPSGNQSHAPSPDVRQLMSPTALATDVTQATDVTNWTDAIEYRITRDCAVSGSCRCLLSAFSLNNA